MVAVLVSKVKNKMSRNEEDCVAQECVLRRCKDTVNVHNFLCIGDLQTNLVPIATFRIGVRGAIVPRVEGL